MQWKQQLTTDDRLSQRRGASLGLLRADLALKYTVPTIVALIFGNKI